MICKCCGEEIKHDEEFGYIKLCGGGVYHDDCFSDNAARIMLEMGYAIRKRPPVTTQRRDEP